MQKLNRAFIRDAVQDFLNNANLPYSGHSGETAYHSGAHDFARYLQERFPEEKNIHLSKDGEVQNLYRFHFTHGGLPTSKQKWMTEVDANVYADKNGYRLELIRTTHKPV